jgi:hypothetical protein
MPNPYINSAMQSQDLGGLNAVYQNMAAQQQMQNQAAMQGQQLTQQAGQTAKGGMNPMAMAMMLRKKPNDGITAQGTGLAYDANGQNPYGYTPQGPDYNQPVGNLFSAAD